MMQKHFRSFSEKSTVGARLDSIVGWLSVTHSIAISVFVAILVDKYRGKQASLLYYFDNFTFSWCLLNMARGTTDPEIDSVFLRHLLNNRWRSATCIIWPPVGITHRIYKFGHWLAPLTNSTKFGQFSTTKR